MGTQIFFSSDLHLGHENLRTFRNQIHSTSHTEVSDVDQWLLNNWNSKVRHKDITWILGDVAWSKSDLEWLHLFNGRKKLILGNHDTEMKDMTIHDYLPYFESIHGIHKKYGFVMSHAPIHPNEIQPQYRWTHNVHGHIHHPDQCIEDPRYINVNTDVRNGMPVHLDEIRTEINANNTQ